MNSAAPTLIQLIPSERDWVDYLTLFASVSGPILAGLFGFWILRITKRIEISQWRNQKLVEKRIEVWDEVGPKINDVYCYCVRVGTWKNLSPAKVVEWKRQTDKLVHTNRPYFSGRFFERYHDFTETCFATFQGHGVDAKLKTSLQEHKTAHERWEPSWDALFCDTPASDEAISARYNALLRQLASEFNVEE